MNLNPAIPVLVNGMPTACLSTLDRGLLYGDGLFETIMVRDGKPRFWACHMQRLQAGCERLGISPCDTVLLKNEADSLLDSGAAGALKVIVTRGSGGRGYLPAAGTAPTRILQLHPWHGYSPVCTETGITARICRTRLGHNRALAGIKHLNRLEQVMARREWDDAGILEGLLLDHEGCLIEGTMSNIFLVMGGRLVTPALDRCGVAGIMRSRVLDAAERQGLEVEIRHIRSGELAQANEIFVCNSVIGIWPVVMVDGLAWRKGEITTGLQQYLVAYSDNNPAWRDR